MSAPQQSIVHAGPGWFDAPLSASVATAVSALVAQLRPGAIERDLAGGAPIQEAGWLRESGLTELTIADSEPLGLRWTQALSVLRRLARTDLSAAALLGYNYMHRLRLALAAPASLFEPLRLQMLAAPGLWGGANNPGGPGAAMHAVDGGYVLNGRKQFASVAQVADWLIVGENCQDASGATQRLVFVLDARSDGIGHGDDWTGIGARRTASGSLTFEAVFVPQAQVFLRLAPGQAPEAPAASLGSLAFQVMFINLLVGAAQGACELATATLRARDTGRTGYPAHVLEALGVSVAAAQSAALLADRANEALIALVTAASAGELSWAQRGAAADVISQAKIIADQQAQAVTQRIFETTGARGASTTLGLDRYWRDVRTFTLHDPVAVKAQEVGRYALSGDAAQPSANS